MWTGLSPEGVASERLTISRDTATIVSDSVEQNDRLPVLMFRHNVPALQYDSIGSFGDGLLAPSGLYIGAIRALSDKAKRIANKVNRAIRMPNANDRVRYIAIAVTNDFGRTPHLRPFLCTKRRPPWFVPTAPSPMIDLPY